MVLGPREPLRQPRHRPPLKGLGSDDGPPPSLQLIAPWWQEDLLLGIAGYLEAQGLVGFAPPPIFYGDGLKSEVETGPLRPAGPTDMCWSNTSEWA